MTDYSEYNLHLTLCNETDPDIILEGFALRSKDRTSFLVDLRALVKRYDGVFFDELAEQDWEHDTSLQAALRASSRLDTPEVVEVPAKPQLRLK